jgi:hypothetical protein
MMSSIIDDVEEVITIMTIFPLLVVLSYPSMRVIVNQMLVATG